MKIFFTFLFFGVFCLNAQVFKIDTTEITFEDKLRTCLSVNYDAHSDFVKSSFKDYCKKNFNVKIKGYGFLSNADIILAEDAVINKISDKRLNIYNRVIALPEGGSESKLFVSFGYDFFVNPKDFPEAFKNLNQLLNNFSLQMLIDFYTESIEDMNKDIKKTNRDSKKQERTINKYTKRLTSSKYEESEKLEYSGKIDVAKKEIENNNLKLQTLREKIVAYNQKLTLLING